jgi:hypothetical protein
MNSQELLGINQFREFGMPEFVTRSGNAERRAVLEDNRLRREGRLDKPHNLGFGGVALRIPPLDYEVIKIMYPDVTSKDHEIRTRAWQKFANSPESEPYRVHRKTRGQVCRSITAR